MPLCGSHRRFILLAANGTHTAIISSQDEFSAFLEVPQDNACRRLHTFQVQFCYQISDGIFQALANGIVTAHRLLNLAMLKNLDMRQTGISTMMKHMIQGLGMEMESSHVEE